MKIMKILIAGIMLTWITSCSDYLDIVPDNVATIEYAFRMRSTAEQYLFTCYSFIPKLGTIHQYNPALSRKTFRRRRYRHRYFHSIL